MRTYDMTPFLRSTVGFDRLFNELIDTATKIESGGYPPYNIERLDENQYEITLAVAGFSDRDIEIEVIDRDLRVTGQRDVAPESQREFLHQGIAGRNFDRRFRLAEHVQVTGASLANGLLTVSLEREVPEAKKPRKIAIGAQDAPRPQVVKTSDAA